MDFYIYNVHMAKHIPYLFLTAEEINNKQIKDDNFHHLIKVLRMKENSPFFVMDNIGNKFNCIISRIDKNKADYLVKNYNHQTKQELSVNLIQAVTKIETFEEILDKSTQLGVDKIYPLITKNVSQPIDIFEKKMYRFEKILKSSSEQSQRYFLPVLENIIDIYSLKNKFNKSNTLIAYEKSDIPLKNFLKDYSGKEINIICGPEGGFSEQEIEELSEYNNFTLGKNILRAETAAITIIGNINYELDYFS